MAVEEMANIEWIFGGKEIFIRDGSFLGSRMMEKEEKKSSLHPSRIPLILSDLVVIYH